MCLRVPSRHRSTHSGGRPCSPCHRPRIRFCVATGSGPFAPHRRTHPAKAFRWNPANDLQLEHLRQRYASPRFEHPTLEHLPRFSAIADAIADVILRSLLLSGGFSLSSLQKRYNRMIQFVIFNAQVESATLYQIVGLAVRIRQPQSFRFRP